MAPRDSSRSKQKHLTQRRKDAKEETKRLAKAQNGFGCLGSSSFLFFLALALRLCDFA
jgi:hypothetical protein